MKSGILVWCMLFGWSFCCFAEPGDVIFQGRAASALSILTIYTDSTFSKPSSNSFAAGQLLEVIGETELEHEDDAQNQTFKWYRVRGSNGREGWVFGDGLAVLIPENQLDAAAKPFYKKKMEFGPGFEKSIVWMAAVEGHDNFHAGGLLNPIYFESYIIITNQRGKSVHIYYSGESTQGKSDLQEMEFQELTGDGIPDLVLLANYIPGGSSLVNRKLELYSFQAGTINKVFEERLNLPPTENKPSPCPFKFIELDEGTIRVEYVEFKPCQDYSLPLKTNLSGSSTDQCLEYVTYTYHWNGQQRNYQLIYEESRSAPQIQTDKHGVVLQSEPNPSAPRLRAIRPNETMDVIRQQDTWITERGKQRREAYFFVRLSEGTYGYVPVNFAHFIQTAHSEQLDHYYRHPLSQAKREALSFFSIRGIRQDSSAYNH